MKFGSDTIKTSDRRVRICVTLCSYAERRNGFNVVAQQGWQAQEALRTFGWLERNEIGIGKHSSLQVQKQLRSNGKNHQIVLLSSIDRTRMSTVL